MCSKCGTWMVRKWVTEKSSCVCYYYDCCPRCEEELADILYSVFEEVWTPVATPPMEEVEFLATVLSRKLQERNASFIGRKGE